MTIKYGMQDQKVRIHLDFLLKLFYINDTSAIRGGI